MKIKNEKGFSIIGMLLFIAIIVVVCLLVAKTANIFVDNEIQNSIRDDNTVQEENIETE